MSQGTARPRRSRQPVLRLSEGRDRVASARRPSPFSSCSSSRSSRRRRPSRPIRTTSASRSRAVRNLPSRTALQPAGRPRLQHRRLHQRQPRQELGGARPRSHRLTAKASNSAPATQTYTMSVVADHEDVTRPGYDFISVPVVNAALSTAGACNINVGPLQTGAPRWRHRPVDVAGDHLRQPAEEHDLRLRLLPAPRGGLAPLPGLVAALECRRRGSGQHRRREVPLPVNEIQPQTLAKEHDGDSGHRSHLEHHQGGDPGRADLR